MFERYSVREIGYDERDNISSLTIVDRAGNVVYKMGKAAFKTVAPKPQDEDKPKTEEKPGKIDIARQVCQFCDENGFPVEYILYVFGRKDISEISEKQAQMMIPNLDRIKTGFLKWKKDAS